MPILQHFQPSQLTDYSPKCKTTYSRKLSTPVYSNARKRGQPILGSDNDSNLAELRLKAIKSKDRGFKVTGKVDGNEIRFFKYIHIVDTLVWTKEGIINDNPAQVSTREPRRRRCDHTSVLSQNELLKQMVGKNFIRSVSGRNSQQIHVIRALSFDSGDLIAAWLNQRRLKPCLVKILDPRQQEMEKMHANIMMGPFLHSS